MFSCSCELHIEYFKDNFTSDFSRRNELGTKERFVNRRVKIHISTHAKIWYFAK